MKSLSRGQLELFDILITEAKTRKRVARRLADPTDETTGPVGDVVSSLRAAQSLLTAGGEGEDSRDMDLWRGELGGLACAQEPRVMSKLRGELDALAIAEADEMDLLQHWIDKAKKVDSVAQRLAEPNDGTMDLVGDVVLCLRTAERLVRDRDTKPGEINKDAEDAKHPEQPVDSVIGKFKSALGALERATDGVSGGDKP